jgi:hypothetical protein
MRGNMLAGIPRATQLRARELNIPAAAAAAIGQTGSVVRRLGGRFIWHPAASLGPSVNRNSGGDGGVPPFSDLVGLALDQSNGWGFAGQQLIQTPVEASIAGWTTAGSVTTSFVGGELRIASSPGNGGVFRDLVVTPNVPVLALYKLANVAGPGGAFTLFDGASFVTPLFNSPNPGNLSTIVTPATGILRVYLFVNTGGTFDVSSISVRAISSTVADAITQNSNGLKPLLVPHLPYANALSFDGMDDILQTAPIAGAAVETVLLAMRPNAAADMDVFSRQTTGALGSFWGRRTSAGNVSVVIHDGTAFRSAVASGGAPVGEMRVFSFCKAAARCFIRVNGVEIASSAFAGGAQAAPAPFAIGAGIAALYGAQTHAAAIWMPAEPSAAEFAVMERGLGFLAGAVTA